MIVIIFAEELCEGRPVYLLDIDDEYNSRPVRSSCH